MKPRLATLLGGVLSAACPLLAQTVTPARPAESEPVEVLSPFVVQSAKDTGYQATSTLAGTRLNTPVKDLAASISIYTKDLIEDIGATNSSELLIYATGTDAAGAGGNFSGANNDINEPRPSGNSARIDPQGTSRSRGLAAPTFTRGYFATAIPFDAYNTGAVTVNRGPNAALFGVGSAAGVVDTAMIEPEFRGNRHSVALRYGNNDSLRASTDFNFVLMPQKIAFRLAMLREREEFNQRPAFEDKRRVYGALTIKPTPTTVLRANFETGRTTANRPLLSLPYNSASTPWLAAGRPSYDWRTYDDPAYTGPRGTATEGFFHSNSITLGPTYVYNNPTDRAPSIAFMSTTPGTTANAANAVRSATFHPIANRNLLNDSIRFLHTQNIFDFPAGYWTAANVPRGQLPGFVPAGIKAQGFTDFSAFDWKNRLIDESSRQNESFHAFNARIEQSFWQNHAGIELAYDTQRIDRRSRNSFFSINNANHVFIDTSVTLPNGQANPNLGRPYAVYGLSNWRDRFDRREAAHATGFLRYDFKDLNRGWARWLGRHSLTGLYEESRVDILDQRPVTSTLGEALDATTTGDLGINTRRPGIIVYMGPSIIGNNNPLRLQPIQVPAIQAGPMIPVSYFRRAGNATDPGDFVSAPSTLIDLAGPGTAAREVIKSQAFVLQSNWLLDHLVTTLSWRRDEDFSANQSTAYSINPANPLDPGRTRFGFGDFALFDREPPPFAAKEIKSWGGVLRWPQKWLRLPAGTDVSVFVNRSENFTPLGGRISPFGVSWASPQGETKEHGFNFSTLNDKFSVRVNWFETAITGASYNWSNFTNATVNNIFLAASAWAQEGNINPQMAAARNADIDTLFAPLPANYRALHNFRVSGTAPNISVSGILNTGLAGATDTTDTTAKGLEADLVFNPTPRWRILLNVAKQETVQSNSLPFMKQFVALMKPTWDRLANTPRGNYPTGYVPGSPLPATTQTYGQWLDANLYVPLAIALATEGSVSAEQRKWRANLVTNYTFGSEPFLGLNLRGWAIGGGARWQDKFALGYPTTRLANGGVLTDIANPYWGGDDLNIDLFASYSRPIFSGKIRWKAQLNVRNAIGSDSLLPVTIQPWGEVATTRLAPERRWYLTNTFSF
jgi:outer membrane receptor protein involved in Fe transport